MVSTRRPKRKAAQAALEDIKKARIAEEEEEDFEDEEEDEYTSQALFVFSPNQAKQQKSIKSLPPFEMLPIDVLPSIFLYFDSARDVYSLANCAKYLRASLTPEIVVRSTVFQGGKARESIEEVVGAIKRKSIHVPSTLRLLRLVNGKKCERGDQCFAYNLVEKAPEKLAKSGKRPFGLAICRTCAMYMSGSVLRLLDADDRIESVDWNRLLLQPYCEAATGEIAGPLVLAQPARQIETSYPHHDQQDERKEALDQLLKDILETTSADDTARAEQFVSAHETAESQFHAFQQAKVDIIDNKWEEKEVLRAARKRKNAQIVISKIEKILQDYEHTDFALQCRWDDWGCCHLLCSLVDDVLGPLLRAPSTATRRKITAAADSAREVVDLLHSNGFMPSNYLSFLQPQEQPHHRALYQYCHEEKPLDELLRYGSFSQFMTLLRQNMPVGALLNRLGRSGSSYLGAVFSHDVVRGDDQDQRSKHELLAKGIWSRNVSNRTDVDTEEKFRQKFEECCTEFQSLEASIRDYLADPLTIEFLQETDPPPHQPDQWFTRQNAVDKIYHCNPYHGYGYNSSASLRFLRARDFQSLRTHHRNLFLNPRQYRVYNVGGRAV